MAKSCTFCKRTNTYICNANEHCGLCPLGDEPQQAEFDFGGSDEDEDQ